ncbi:Mu-like prophage major head subunit gpT family protein [Maledivibacter halophilus]|uniref:Mu-like prophage major head subunit gpT n=1 Tax=Maledivibacter halophilus TaxID=36842 RepID=A0A1T5L6Z4_9FIRM|nr:Mu-like prophage major head subunit gpT family protein [Maledivibacter halophilus]SKC68341.1 Mu-like prophage major head subunit gpT [Maledivibacter halophilus]SKC71710.1 Mu-like prophage major head subunit gpT [Maledivibacter halophilus]SKC80185.1 Mu-like prophage major head subunit gpT [Maledivibacter halophilus]
MLVNQQVLQSIYTNFRVIYNKAFENAKPLYTKIATVIPSSTAKESYKWLGKVPRMKEWISDRVIQNLSAYDYEIKNKDFEVTVSVDRNDIEDDSIGVYRPIIQEMGNSAAMHPDELVFPLLINGFTNKCYDKKAFFADDHKEGKSGSQSNKSTYKLTLETYGDARASMMSFKDDRGKPLKVTPNLLVVPPQLESQARRILYSEQIEGTTNIYKGSAELLIAPELSINPTAWFLLDVSRPVRPTIFQQRKKPKFVSMTKESDTNVFMNKKYIYGADSRDNAGYGLWQLAFGSTGEEDKPL